MAIYNTNPLTRVDDDSIIESTFIRIISFTSIDKNTQPSDVTCQFGIYSSYIKWNENWQGNAIKMKYIPNNNIFTVKYSREKNGMDIAGYLYTKLIEYLAFIFPEWDIDKIYIDLDPAPDYVNDPGIL